MTDQDGSETDDKLHALQSEDTEPMVLSDDQVGRVYKPPPHIAARFHRPNTTRRRPSANSSRRNSISSSHSHASNRTLRRQCQNHAVAQQLRRTSILESRKARLADRAAHAEQVRLRAAMAKSVTRNTNTEEKFLAAQQAREKFLARVASACAEEVARAKKVAEEHKERTAAAERKNRLELEEKHAEAERRRLELLRAPRKSRTLSTSNRESKQSPDRRKNGLSLDVACRRIQQAWRFYKRRSCITAFCQLDVSVDRVTSMTFNDAKALIEQAEVIARTHQLMQQLGLGGPTCSPSPDASVEARTFLSAYMVLGHAKDVFSQLGQQEEEVMAKAKALLLPFEATIAALPRSCEIPQPRIAELKQALEAFQTAFTAWKKADVAILLDTMVDQFVVLDSIWQSVKGDNRGQVADDYRSAVRDQQVLLLVNIKRLAGADVAQERIKAAVHEARRGRRRPKPLRELRPRPAEAIAEDIPQRSLLQDSRTTAAVQHWESSSNQASQDARSPTPQSLSLHGDQTDISRLFSAIPPNRVLVHELMIDPTYRIEAHSDARSMLNRSICDSMRRAISNSQDNQGRLWTIAVADNIRSRLLKLLQPSTSLYKIIDEVLDSAHVRNQCEMGQFNYESFFGFMADLLPRLCAPVRDDEVKALCNVLKTSGNDLDAMVEKLFGLFHVIDELSLDYTNYMISQAAPKLIQEGPGYEARAFAAQLEPQNGNGRIDHLPRLRQWWNASRASLQMDSAVHGDLTSLSHDAIFTKIYSRGLADLAVHPGPLPEQGLPETLCLDVDRLRKIRGEMTRLIAVGAILLTAKNLLRRDVRTQWKAEARRLGDVLAKEGYCDTGAEGDTDQASSPLVSRLVGIVESAHGMPPASRQHLLGVTSRFLQQIHTLTTQLPESAASSEPDAMDQSDSTPQLAAFNAPFTDPVLKVLHTRLRNHLTARLSAPTSTERARAASAAGEGLAAMGLSEFIGQVGGVAEELGKVMRADMAGHANWLRELRI